MSFRFALVGSGNIAATYCRLVGKMPDAEVAAIVSRSGRRPDWADGRVEVAPSVEAVQTGFDAVIIASPNGTHREFAVAAARRGKHVLTEKVLEISSAAGEEIIAECRRNQVKLGVSFQRRFSPDNLIVSELLAQRRFGRLIGAEFRIPFFRAQSYYDSAAYRGTRAIDGGGAFIQQAAHQLDLYCWFFGLPERVHSEMGRFLHEMESEDHGVALLRHADGMIGSIVASTCAYPGFDPELTLITESGTLRMVNDRIRDWHIRGLDRPGGAPEVEIHSGADSAGVTHTDGHECILEDFVDAIRTDREPMVNGEAALGATQLVEMIYQQG